jgi:hypothetical protein
VIIVATIFIGLLIVLSCYVALVNLAGTYLAIQRNRKGISGGYSSVPIVSLMLCLMVVGLAYEVLGLWPLIPALIDPGTWSVVILPFFLVWQVFKKS